MAKKIRTMEVNIGPESHGSRYHLRMGKALWRWLTVEELVDVSSALNGELSRVLREREGALNVER